MNFQLSTLKQIYFVRLTQINLFEEVSRRRRDGLKDF